MGFIVNIILSLFLIACEALVFAFVVAFFVKSDSAGAFFVGAYIVFRIVKGLYKSCHE